MTLSIAGRPLGQCWAQLWYKLRLPLFASPLYRWMLQGPPAFQLAVAPPDPGADHNARVMARIRAFRGWDPYEHRLLIVLRDIQGMSYADIRKVTGLQEGTLKSRLHRARLALKERLQPYLE